MAKNGNQNGKSAADKIKEAEESSQQGTVATATLEKPTPGITPEDILNFDVHSHYVREDDPNFYSTDPENIHEDVIVNTSTPIFLALHGNSTFKMLKGDRIQSKRYRLHVERDLKAGNGTLRGLRIARRLPKELLEKCEAERRKRMGELPSEYVKESWRRSSDPKVQAMGMEKK